MPRPHPTPPAERVERTAQVGLAATAFAVHLPLLTLPWRQDDLVVVPDAVRQVGWVLETIVRFATGHDAGAPLGASRLDWLFQPLPGLLWSIAGGVQGAAWGPMAFRAVALLLHVAVVVLLFRFLRRRLPLAAAVTGAALVALNAAGFQAVAWIAATPDVLLTFLALVALHAATGTERRAIAVSAVATAACLWTKSTGFMVVPLIVAVWCRPDVGSIARRARIVLVHALTVGLALLVRTAYLGYVGPRYAEGAHLADAFAPLAADIAIPFLRQWAAPWNGTPDAEGLWPIAARIGDATVMQRWAALPMLVLTVAGLVIPSPVRSLARRNLLPAALLAIPTLWIFHHADAGTSISRAFYPLQVPAAVAVACGIAALGTPSRRALGPLLSAVVLIPWIDAAVSNIRIECEAGRRTVLRADGIERALAASPDAAVAFIDPGASFAGIGLRMMPERFRPPFRRDPADVAAFDDVEALTASTWWTRTDGVLRLARWENDDVVVDPRPIGARADRLPEFERAERSEGVTRFLPDRIVAPRSADGVVLECAAHDADTAVVLRIGTDRGPVEKRFSIPAGPACRVPLLLDDVATWAFAAELRDVSVSPEIATGIACLPRRAGIKIRGSPHRSRISAGAPVGLALDTLPEGTGRVRLHVNFLILNRSFPMLGTVTLAPRTTSGTVVFDDTATWTSVYPDLAPRTLAELMRRHLAPVGRDEIPARIHVEALLDDGVTRLARSDPFDATFFLPRDP